MSLLVIGSIMLASMPILNAQTSAAHKAKLLVTRGKQIDAHDVDVTLGPESFDIKPIKRSGEARSLPSSSIKSIEYSYSDRPRYTVGTAGVLAIGLVAVPLFFNKTKKNWLVINAGGDPVVLQLLSSNYRMLLLEIQRSGINISDVGDRDDKKGKGDKKANRTDTNQP